MSGEITIVRCDRFTAAEVFRLHRLAIGCKNEFCPKFQNGEAFVRVSDEEVSALLLRLAHNVLPNIVPDGTLLGVPATFATILNACALCRANLLLKRDAAKGPDDVHRELQKLERLTAKAFEVSYVQKQYSIWRKDKKT